MYHHGKANVVADALSRKTMSALIQDIFSRMMVTSPLMDMIKKAQIEGLKKENWKTEQIMGHILLFVRDSKGLLMQCGRVWDPIFGCVRQKF